MLKNKLFSIKKDNNIILYKLEYDDQKLNNFINNLDEKYTKIENDTIETTFSGIIPLSYGKYNNLRNVCYIRELGVVDSKKNKQSEEYFKSLGGTTKEWNFLSDEEKLLFMPIEGYRKGKLKLEITYPSILALTLRSTFLNEREIVDTTKLNKVINHVSNYTNDFVFDKTIDLNNDKKKWSDDTRVFFSINEYNNYIEKISHDLNEDNIIMSKYEFDSVYDDYSKIYNALQSIFKAEQIGMFPEDLKLSEDLEILKRFAKRNESFELLSGVLEYAPINFDGGAVLNEKRNTICSNYNIDGKVTEDRIISRIDLNAKVLNRFNGKFDDENYIKSEILTKKIKAA